MISVYLIVCYSDNLLEYVSYCWCYWFALGLVFAHLSHYRPVVPVARRPARHLADDGDAAVVSRKLQTP